MPSLMRLYCEFGQVTPSTAFKNSTLTKNAIARLKTAQQVSSILCSQLHFDAFTGLPCVGKVWYARRRDLLLRQLYHGGSLGNVEDSSDDFRVVLEGKEWARIVEFAQPCGRWWLDALVAKRSFQRGVLVLDPVFDSEFSCKKYFSGLSRDLSCSKSQFEYYCLRCMGRFAL